VAAELERRWEVALQAVAEARERAEQLGRHPSVPELPSDMRAQFQALGRTLPELRARGHFTSAQQKALVHRLI
jgi:hypothetical protein